MPFAGPTSQTFLHHATGPTLVTFGGHDIGYAEDRVMINERPQWEDIRNDIFGGMAGIPSDVQYLGSIVIVQANINRFKLEEMKYLASLNTTVGDDDTATADLPLMGTLFRQGDNTASHMEQLILTSTVHKLTFTIGFLRQGRQFNMGTRHQQVALMFECHVADPCDMNLYTIVPGTNPCP